MYRPFANAVILLAGFAAPTAAERPNVVLIFTDDQGTHDVGCYGSEIPTPNIDSLARDGLKFNAWYVASSICTPSRYGLLTGRMPSRSQDRLLHALMFLGDRDKQRGIQNGELTFPSLLQRNGYRTALIGKWHLGHGNNSFLPTQHGFSSFYGHTAGCIDYFTMRYGIQPDWYRDEKRIDEGGYATNLITDEAVRFLKSQKNGKPFFLHLAYNAPHFGKGWDAQNKRVVNIMQPHPTDMRRVRGIKDVMRRQFAARVVALDDGVGRVLKAIDDAGLKRNTLVIFMTDHGGDPDYGGSNLPFRGEKATLYEGGIRVPCLMRWFGRIKAGTTCDEVCSALDVFPTLGRLAGINTDKLALDGKDITGVILGQESLPQRELFWQLGMHSELERGNWTAVRIGRWKYLNNNLGEEMLFDLQKDPYEKKSLFNSLPKIAKRLRSRRDELLLEFDRDADSKE
ncbi:MAG: sulfatase-like hydrolase/transferase [Planctomycetota bacterium]|nr:sulfatase-like hydrolase/transferase [Planctomycetota bacterium]